MNPAWQALERAEMTLPYLPGASCANWGSRSAQENKLLILWSDPG